MDEMMNMSQREKAEAVIVLIVTAFAAGETYENNVNRSSLFNRLLNPSAVVSTQGPGKSELEQKLNIILGNQKFTPDFSKIVITCVDPKYPAAAIDPEKSDPVRYNSQHTQQAAPGDAQVSLKYDGNGNVIPIAQTSVHDSLKQGVVQLDQHLATLVIGIPGDCYAFNPSGTGFSFDNPGYAKPQISEQLLGALISYSKSSSIEFYVMSHSDCGLFANNEGKRRYVELARSLENDISSFPSSSYARIEHDQKMKGAEHLKKFLSAYPNVTSVNVVTPSYQPRTPGIVKALHARHATAH